MPGRNKEDDMKLIKFVPGLAIALATGMAWAAEPATPATAAQSAEPTAAQSASAEASAPETTPNTGTVSRTAFTSAVENREPTDKLSSLTNDQGEILFFTELRDMAGQSVIHRWEHGGKIFAEVPFQVGGNRWRVYSSKQLDPSWTGTWKASVVSANGETLSVSTFNYEAAPEAPAQAAPETPETPTDAKTQ
jgi:hypothetical protein